MLNRFLEADQVTLFIENLLSMYTHHLSFILFENLTTLRNIGMMQRKNQLENHPQRVVTTRKPTTKIGVRKTIVPHIQRCMLQTTAPKTPLLEPHILKHWSTFFLQARSISRQSDLRQSIYENPRTGARTSIASITEHEAMILKIIGFS